jgi:amino acid adenylation domain-containing protein
MNRDNIEDIYQLSPAQQGILFHSLYSPDSGVYFVQQCYTLHGNLDIVAFEDAWQQVVTRHTALRTSFYWENLDKPAQVVHRVVKVPLKQYDWRGIDPTLQQEQLEAFLESDRKQGFDMSQESLIRLTLIGLSDDCYQFIWSKHHLILDGWSTALVLKDVVQRYEALCQGQNVPDAPSKPYGDYIAWLQQQDLSKAETFWRQFLSGIQAPTPLISPNIDKPHPAEYDEQQIKLSQTTTATLQSVVRQHQLTLSTLVQGAWAILLSRYSREEDVIYGSTVSGRPADLAGAESIVGLFINTLPVRVTVDANTALLPWLERLQAQLVEMRQYEYSPLVEIQGWSEVPRGVPLFESIVVFENYPVDRVLRESKVNIEIQNVSAFDRTNYPLTAIAIPGSELEFKIAYDRNRFDCATITRMLGHFQTLLEGMATNPNSLLKDLPLLTKAEKHQLLIEWNDTQAESSHEKCIHQLFEEQVERTPDAVAVVFEDEQLTYRELNQQANQLAHYLRKLGVKPEVLVGICIERSPLMLVGLLGILKAGGAYVPLDPSYPQKRLAFMLSDARVQVLVTQQHLIEKLPSHEAQVVRLDTDSPIITKQSQDNPVNISKVDNLAYVIYTSGSTGQPKGVLGLHQGAINRFYWMWKTYPFTQAEVCCQKTSLNFVDSIWEIFGPLLQGIRTVIVPDIVIKAPQKFVETLASNKVTRLVLVPSLLRVLLATYSDLQKRLPHLKHWVTSGEALAIDLLQNFRQTMPESTLLNLYGSSEVSADVTCYSINPQAETPLSVAIGRPITNTQLYVLDKYLNCSPIGIPGELYIGGAGLARGYLNRPEMTAERFIPNPFENSKFNRLYKTGDLVRYLSDGNLEYIGRLDHQVKIRGFRIELGEIEAVISQYPAVLETVVVVRSDLADAQSLVAYVVSHSDPTLTIPELRRFVKSKLPNYMIPAAFVLLEALPLTPNGKVDRAALPALNLSRSEVNFVPPRNLAEERVAAIYAEVLRQEMIGSDDNFFELGGHSLLATQVISRLREAFDIELPLRSLFENPTVADIAALIETMRLAVTQASHPSIDVEKGRKEIQI